MSELEIVLLLLYGWGIGVVFGYILWAPDSNFKQAFMDGLSLKFIWGRFIK